MSSPIYINSGPNEIHGTNIDTPWVSNKPPEIVAFRWAVLIPDDDSTVWWHTFLYIKTW
jgi:hypothetical protein